MPNTNLENAKTNMKSRIRNRAAISTTPRDLGRLAKSARFVGLVDDSEVETELDTQMASAIPSASIDDLVSLSEGINELRDRRPALGGMTSTDQMVEGSRKFLNANSVQPAISVSGDLSYDNGVVSYTTPTSAALQVVATVGDLPAGASPGDQAVVQSNNKLYIKTAEGWYAVALINTAPSVSGNDATYTLATDGTPTVITMTATDPENDPVSFSHSVTSGDLNGTTVDQADNVFTITPHASQAATFELTFSANDSVNVATSSASSFTLAFAVELDFSNYDSTKIEVYSPENNTQDEFGRAIIANGGTKFIAAGKKWGGNGHWTGLFDISDTSSLSSPQDPYAFMVWAKKNGDSSYNGGLSGVTTDNYGIASGVCEYNMSDTYYSVRNYFHNDKIRIYNLSDGQLFREITVPAGNSYSPTADAGVGNKQAIDGDSIYIPQPHGQPSNFGGAVHEYSISTGNLLGTLDYAGTTYATYGAVSGARARYFGSNIAVSDSYVAVGCPGDTVNDSTALTQNNQSGRVYIYDKSTRNCIAQIGSPNPVHEGVFGGYENAGNGLSASGIYLAIGAPKEDGVRGRIYIYDMSTRSSPSLLHTLDRYVYTNIAVSTEFGDYMSSQGKYVATRDQLRGGFIVIDMESGTVSDEMISLELSHGAFLQGMLAEDAFVLGDRTDHASYNGRGGRVTIIPSE